MPDYMGRLCRTYHWSLEYVLFELPMVEGWVMYCVAIEQDGWMQFSGVKRTDGGYIGQQIEKNLNRGKNVKVENRD